MKKNSSFVNLFLEESVQKSSAEAKAPGKLVIRIYCFSVWYIRVLTKTGTASHKFGSTLHLPVLQAVKPLDRLAELLYLRTETLVHNNKTHVRRSIR